MNKFTLKQLNSMGNEEMLLASLVGKVSERIALPRHEMPFYRRKQQWLDAGNLIMEHIKAGNVVLRKEITCVNEQFKTLTYIRVIGAKSLIPKDINKGFELTTPSKCYQKAVRNVRLKPSDKEILQNLSSIKFYRSEFCTDSYLQAIQNAIPVDPNMMEQPWKRKGRLEGYKKAALMLDSFYLPYKYDGRGRMYPEGATLEGFRPHGKAVESMCFEVESRQLTDSGREVLSELRDEGFDGLIKELREPQLNKALDTNKTGMLVECDITNSGLLIAGLSFRSPEMLLATNGYACSKRADSHKLFGDVYGLTREDAKKVHTPLLHGASNKSIAEVLVGLTGEEFTAEDVRVGNEKAYGKAAENINNIAQYGRKVMSNYRSECGWTMPDGFRATHRAYTVHVPMELQLEGRKLKVMSSMPLLLDGSGRPVYDSKTPGAKEKTVTKMMGLYADIIHSIDAFVMREVIRSGIELLAKHDAFLVHPNDVDRLRTVLKKTYSLVFAFSIIKDILSQIERSTGEVAPKLFIGDAEDRMCVSECFMTVE